MKGAMLLSLFAIGLVSLVVYLNNTLWVRAEKMREKLRRQGITGPAPSLFYGNILQMKRIQREQHKSGKQQVPDVGYFSILFPYLDLWAKEYGSLFIYSTGNIQILHLRHPGLLKEIGLCKSLDLGKPSFLHKERAALVGRGIFGSNGAAWAHQRKVIAPELYMKRVKGMVSSIAEAAIPLLSSWESKIKSQRGTVELVVDEYLRVFSMDAISRACFGSSYLKGKEVFSRLRQLQKVMSKSSLFIGIPGLRYLPTKTNREIWRLNHEIRSLILNIAKERKELRPNSSQKDLLQSIIDSAGTGPDAADDFIVDNCKSIYFAGHETTTLSATWCLLLLSTHPEWQVRARTEVIDVCKGQMPDADMLSKMKVLTMVIQETLRHYPPSPFVTRELFEEMKIGDVNVPKGVTIQIPIASLHHDPEIWGPDAGEFNPGRFKNSISGACKLPHTYIPFGVGARTCVGQNFAMVELKIIISLLLSRFSFSLSPRLCTTFEPPQLLPTLSMPWRSHPDSSPPLAETLAAKLPCHPSSPAPLRWRRPPKIRRSTHISSPPLA